MPQVVEEILEVIKVISQERESERIVVLIFDVPVLQVLEEIVVAVSQVVEEILEVFKVIPQERVSEFFVEQVVDVPVPQVLEDIVAVVRLFSGAHPTSHRWGNRGFFGTTGPGADCEVIQVFYWSGCLCASWEQIVDARSASLGGNR